GAGPGLQLLPESAHMGLWAVAHRRGGLDGARERVGLGPVEEPESGQVVRRGELNRLTATIKADPRRDSSLNDAILSGFREVRDEYREDMNNVLLVITAGKDDGRGLTLPGLLQPRLD